MTANAELLQAIVETGVPIIENFIWQQFNSLLASFENFEDDLTEKCHQTIEVKYIIILRTCYVNVFFLFFYICIHI